MRRSYDPWQDIRTRSYFAILPVFGDNDVRWLERVGVVEAKGFRGWRRLRFSDEPPCAYEGEAARRIAERKASLSTIAIID